MEWIGEEVARNDEFRNSPQDTLLVLALLEPEIVEFI
jgi:hypothetical protein